MNDNLLADLLASLGVINKHPGLPFSTYSVKPHGKMCFIASGIVELLSIASNITELCLERGFPLQLSHTGDHYVCTVEKSCITVEHKNLNRAIIEACALTLEGAMPKLVD